jgi:hypothetical protein
MTAMNHHLTRASYEDQAIGRLIAVLRRRSAGKPRTAGGDQRPASRPTRSAGAVAEWHAMGRTF